MIEIAIIWHRVPKRKGGSGDARRIPSTAWAGDARRRWDHISNVAIDLFAARGFDEVSVDDVAEAAGIARRTLFRYYPSKNALPWGDFDAHLDHMRDLLADLDPDVPLGDALRTALLAFNTFDEAETAGTAADAGDPGDRGAAGVLDDDVRRLARRRRRVRRAPAGRQASDLVPQTVAWTMLGVALSAYEHWLADESVSLAARRSATRSTPSATG